MGRSTRSLRPRSPSTRENVYFGKPSGLLDQMASSVGGFTSIDFKDPEAPVIEKVDFDISAQGYALCVVDTGGNHANLTGEYAAIPAEMKQVAAYFGKEFLREVDEKEFYEHIGDIRKQTGDRAVLRAMHFFDDDRLAWEEAQALRAGDFEAFKGMVLSSGRSSFQRLQNVFAVWHPQEQGLTLAPGPHGKNFWKERALGAFTAAASRGPSRPMCPWRAWRSTVPPWRKSLARESAIPCPSARRAAPRWSFDKTALRRKSLRFAGGFFGA